MPGNIIVKARAGVKLQDYQHEDREADQYITVTEGEKRK
jgi:hypothetical protein